MMKRLLQLLPALACLPAAPALEGETEVAPAGAPAAQGPLVLGEHRVLTDKKAADGDKVEIRIPVLAAEGALAEGPLAEDATVCITVFNLTENLDIVPVQEVLQVPLPGAPGVWKTGEVCVLVSYTADAAQSSGTGGRYYGFTAELRYKGEVVAGATSSEELLPEDDAPADRPADVPPPATPTEEAVPYSDFLKEHPDRTN